MTYREYPAACLHGIRWGAECVQCGRYFTARAAASQTATVHQHSFTPAGMRKLPDWQFVDEQWEALLVCTCGYMEWRKAPPR